MPQPVVIEAVRTPFARKGSVFREVRPDTLLAHSLRGLVDRAGIDPAKIEDVITGCVSQAGEQGANIGRLATFLAGFPVEVPAVTLNRMCGSSQQAIHFAAQAIAAGDAFYNIGCGVENMTRVPMFSDVGSLDKLNPALARFNLVHQGESAELLAEKYKITRQDVDEFSKESHRRASAALLEHRNKEILPTAGIDGEGKALTLDRDEGIRDKIDPAKMASLPTVFRPGGNGVVTAANSSQISDGSAAVLIADREVAVSDGFTPRARFLARVVVGDDPTLQLAGVIPATQKALKRAGLKLDDIDWIEINEAFASVVLSWARELNANLEKVNPWGGAIAHGHPLGGTGAGLFAKMLTGLEATGGRLGLQTMCIGHGMATCTIIERISFGLERAMRKSIGLPCALLAGWLTLVAALACGQEKLALTPEARATAYLAAEVPKWQRENKCFSCHNNGDAARALMLAHSRGFLDDLAPLADTLDFLRKPDKWDANGPDGPFKDEKLARIQFGLALAEARSTGLIEGDWDGYVGARLVAELQKPDGSWPNDAEGTIGSPVTYGAPLASALALRTLIAAKERKFRGPILRGMEWFHAHQPKNVLDSAATLLALDPIPADALNSRRLEALAIIKEAQSPDGGWGPFASSPSEVFDTAIVLIAIAPLRGKLETQIAAGRKYLLAQQLPDGSWPATTRPPGADSYAQKLSTTGWALQALFVSK